MQYTFETLKQEAYKVFMTFNVQQAKNVDDVKAELLNFNSEREELTAAKTAEEAIDAYIDMLMFNWQLNYRLGEVADIYCDYVINTILVDLSSIIYRVMGLQDADDDTYTTVYTRLTESIRKVIHSQYQKVFTQDEAITLKQHYESLGVDVYIDATCVEYENKTHLVRSKTTQKVNGIDYPKDKILKNKSTFIDPELIV